MGLCQSSQAGTICDKMEYAFSNSEMATVYSCLLVNRCERLAETECDRIFFWLMQKRKAHPNSHISYLTNNLKRGVSRVSLYPMRRSFVAVYLKKGRQIGSPPKALGHQTIEIAQRYEHYFTEELVVDIDIPNV